MILIPRHKVMETPESASEIIFVCGQGLYVVRMPTYSDTEKQKTTRLTDCMGAQVFAQFYVCKINLRKAICVMGSRDGGR